MACIRDWDVYAIGIWHNTWAARQIEKYRKANRYVPQGVKQHKPAKPVDYCKKLRL